jgi:Skp family chaperone for outer membrane proteins
MRKKLLFCFCITLLTVTIASAQGRPITNLDLEKYRVTRIAADKELRENYEKLGFPSPEELERRREKSRVETEELAAKLRADRNEQERIDAQRETARSVTVYNRDAVRQNDWYLSNGYYYSPYVNRYPRQRTQSQPGYFAGGQFWLTGPATKPRPLFVRPRTR